MHQKKENPKAVLVGASSAIGAEILRWLRESGYSVLATYNRNAASIAGQGEGLEIAAVDLASAESVNAFLPRMDAFGAPDVFINSAGVTQDGLCLFSNEETLRRVTNINYLSPALLSSRAASLMAPRRKGAIVHVTSAAARHAKAGNAAYGASKIALERFTASLALETARFNVRTLCIAPAFVDTPMFAAFAGAGRDQIIRNIPMRRILTPGDVANTVASFVEGKVSTTGTTINLGNGEIVF